MRNTENKIFNQNLRFSRTLKEIDTRLKFKDNSQKYLKDLKKKIYKRNKQKEILDKKNQNHEDIIYNLKRVEEENIKAYNIYSKNLKNNVNYQLTNINLNSIKNNFLVNSKLQDNEKNEDYDVIRFENVWKEKQMNENKYNKGKIIKNKTLYNKDFIDIFDKKYDKYMKKCEEYNEKNIRLKRIKSNNLKVNKKLKIFRHIMSKFQDPREYCPNYNILEKHKPEVKLNTKSKRIFPEKFIRNNTCNTIEISDYKNYKIKLKKKIKKKKSDLLYYIKKSEMINKFPFRNNKKFEDSIFSLEKNKFFISSIDINDIKLKRDVNNINRNKSIINYKRNNSCLSIRKHNNKIIPSINTTIYNNIKHD